MTLRMPNRFRSDAAMVMTVAATMVNPSTSQLACDRLIWNWVAVASSAMFMSDWLNEARRLLPSMSAIMTHIARPVGMAGDAASAGAAPDVAAAADAAVRAGPSGAVGAAGTVAAFSAASCLG